MGKEAQFMKQSRIIALLAAAAVLLTGGYLLPISINGFFPGHARRLR